MLWDGSGGLPLWGAKTWHATGRYAQCPIFGQIAECWDFNHKIVTLVVPQFYFLWHLVKAPGEDCFILKGWILC